MRLYYLIYLLIWKNEDDSGIFLSNMELTRQEFTTEIWTFGKLKISLIIIRKSINQNNKTYSIIQNLLFVFLQGANE